MGLNILLISLDANLAKEKDNCLGNVKDRHIEYAKQLSSLHIVVKTSKNIRYKVKKISDNLFIYPTASLNRYFFLYDAYNLASRICKEYSIDLIVTQDPFMIGLIGWLLKKKYNIPLNIQVHADVIDNEYVMKEAIFNLFLNRLAKRILKKADTIRVVNSRQKEKLVEMGIAGKKIWHIPCFINYELFFQNNGQNIKRQYLSDKFDRLVLYAGRFTKQKNLQTFIQAIPFILREYPKVLFLIVGTGPEEKMIRRLILNAGVNDNVYLTGYISYDKITDFFSACDLFVTTSLYEGTPMALLEAAASKKPIVSTSHTGAYDIIVEGKTGFILNFKDAKNIAQKVIYLLKNHKIAKEMGERAQRFVLEHFDKDTIIRDYIGMLEETVNSFKNEAKGDFK